MKRILLLICAFVLYSSLIAAQGHETFDNFDEPGTSYADGEFEGQDGSTWSYLQSRGDTELNGIALMLGRNRTPDAELTSGLLSNGISWLQFSFMQAFSNNVEMQVYIIDSDEEEHLIYTAESDGEQDEEKSSGIIDLSYLDISGEFKFKFANPDGAQVLIDDIIWGAYDDDTLFYCIPKITNTVEPITNVQVAGINNLSDAEVGGTNGYEDFTHIEGEMTRGNSYPIGLEGNTNGGGFTNKFVVFIDWNQNGILDDEGEVYEAGEIQGSTGEDGQKAFATIVVPVDAELGATRMRIYKSYLTYHLDPCTNESFGQIEDYTIIVSDTDCLPPSEITLTGISQTGAVIEWTANNGETEWELTYGGAGFYVDIEGTTESVTGEPEFEITGLEENTEYDVYIKAICTDGESAHTSKISFFTQCSPASVPYYEDFESAVTPDIPNCTGIQTLSVEDWYTDTPGRSGFNSKTLVYKRDKNNPDDAWFFTRGIEMEAGVNYELSYSYGNFMAGFVDHLKVSMGTQPDADEMDTELGDHEITNGSSTLEVVTLTVPEDGVYYFGFNAYDCTSYVYLDDISIEIGEADETEYCQPEITFSVEPITNVTVAGINNDSAANSNEAYEDFTALVGQMFKGENYPISLEGNTFGSYDNYFTVFIDWNQNGVLDDEGEEYIIGFITGSTGTDGIAATGTISVPPNALSGNTRMRVYKNYDEPIAGPCANSNFGQIEDYTIEVLEPEGCSGMPEGGSTGEDFSVCPLADFTLSVIGASDPASGQERIWQFSTDPDSEDSWADIEGAHSTEYTLINGIEEVTYFRYRVTCVQGDEENTAYSSVVEVSLNQGEDCYCTENLYGASGCALGDMISNVTLAGNSVSLYNDSDCSDGGYGDFTDLPAADLSENQTYTLSVTTSYSVPSTQKMRAWIDYNKNGSFEDGEEIANTGEAGMGEGTVSFEFTVPDGIDLGIYRMRVRMVYAGGPDIDPCTGGDWGETEDYTVEIVEESVDDCPAPTNLMVLNTELASAFNVNGVYIEVVWLPGGNETQWEIKYGEEGFDPDTEGTSIMIMEFNFPNYEAWMEDFENHDVYDFYVRAICSENSVSPWSEKYIYTVSLSVDQKVFESFTYYPNPVDNQLNLKADFPIENIRIHNLTGQKVIELQSDRTEIQLEMDKLSTGVYFMNVTLNGKQKTYRILKK